MAIRASSTAALLFVSAAAALGADRPDIKPGDLWRFAVYGSVPSTVPNRVWRITAVTATGIEGTEDGLPLSLTHELNVLESPRTRESNPRLLSFPLIVGKRWHFDSDWTFKPKNSRGSYSVEVAVVAQEKVAVAAGEFEAFKLTARETLSGTSPIGTNYSGQSTRTYWYAPAARAIVKAVSHSPYLGSSTVELVAMELRP